MNGEQDPLNSEELVLSELKQILDGKGLSDVVVRPDSVLLSDEIGLDSLDLATLVVVLEERTGLRPFEKGFVMFTTFTELVGLFSKS